MNIADNLPVNLNFIRLEARQQRETGIAGTKIINRHANPLTAKLFNGAVELIQSGYHLVFSDFQHHLLWLKPVFFNLTDQKFHCARDIHQRHRQQVDRNFVAANPQLFRQRKGIGFRLEIDLIEGVRVKGAEELLRTAAVIAADKGFKGADLAFRRLNNRLKRKLTGLRGNQAQRLAKG